MVVTLGFPLASRIKFSLLFRSSNYFESCPFPLDFHSFSKQAPPSGLGAAVTVPRSLAVLICGTAHIFLMPNHNSYLPSPKSYLSVQSCGSYTSLCIRNTWGTLKTHRCLMGQVWTGAQASFFHLKPKGVHFLLLPGSTGTSTFQWELSVILLLDISCRCALLPRRTGNSLRAGPVYKCWADAAHPSLVIMRTLMWVLVVTL